jgi:molybdopterin synthase catalytic subunit
MKRISVQQEDFDPGAAQSWLETVSPGAIASFTGLVRRDDGITEMTLEHYPGMTETALEGLAVACASSHRAAALEACAFLIDQLKTNAPFWKREVRTDGSATWVEAKTGDDLASERWRA